jgi:hypothetical protein
VRLAHGGGPLHRHVVEQAVATAAACSPGRFAEALLRFWRAFLAEASAAK